MTTKAGPAQNNKGRHNNKQLHRLRVNKERRGNIHSEITMHIYAFIDLF